MFNNFIFWTLIPSPTKTFLKFGENVSLMKCKARDYVGQIWPIKILKITFQFVVTFTLIPMTFSNNSIGTSLNLFHFLIVRKTKNTLLKFEHKKGKCHRTWTRIKRQTWRALTSQNNNSAIRQRMSSTCFQHKLP